MLVLTRDKTNDTILIGDDIEVVLSKSANGDIKVAISAPPEIKILRKEIAIATPSQNSTKS